VSEWLRKAAVFPLLCTSEYRGAGACITVESGGPAAGTAEPNRGPCCQCDCYDNVTVVIAVAAHHLSLPEGQMQQVRQSLGPCCECDCRANVTVVVAVLRTNCHYQRARCSRCV
jgi:hypothetical protein